MTGPRERLLDEITDRYLSSPDFNGVSLAVLLMSVMSDWATVRANLIGLVVQECLGVVFPDADDNPHILRFGFEELDTQVRKLESVDDLRHVCAYPRSRHLRTVVNPSSYEGRPFTLELAWGEPQLSYRTFDLAVLEAYRNDPRYYYRNDDIEGSISIREEFYSSAEMPNRDKVLMQTFGFAYDENRNRVVAAFLRYLSVLSPEHQQIWKAREVRDSYRLHPEYYGSAVGDWSGGGVSVFVALLMELDVINCMARAMGRPPLFRRDFGPDAGTKPPELTFLVRPTSKELNDFVLALDKVLSDNINKDFFCGEVTAETEEERRDGKIAVRAKGTLSMLDEWLRKKIRLPDWEPWKTALATLHEVRDLRQRPAHALDDNVFDQEYLRRQRNLADRAYQAVRTIRLLLANHPKTKGIEVADTLRRGLVWDI